MLSTWVSLRKTGCPSTNHSFSDSETHALFRQDRSSSPSTAKDISHNHDVYPIAPLEFILTSYFLAGYLGLVSQRSMSTKKHVRKEHPSSSAESAQQDKKLRAQPPSSRSSDASSTLSKKQRKRAAQLAKANITGEVDVCTKDKDIVRVSSTSPRHHVLSYILARLGLPDSKSSDAASGSGALLTSESKQHDSEVEASGRVIIQACTNAMPMAVTLAEIVKRRYPRQVTFVTKIGRYEHDSTKVKTSPDVTSVQSKVESLYPVIATRSPSEHVLNALVPPVITSAITKTASTASGASGISSVSSGSKASRNERAGVIGIAIMLTVPSVWASHKQQMQQQEQESGPS